MKPYNPGGHAAYQKQFVTALREYYPDPNSIPASTWDIMEHFYALDLSFVDSLMEDRYALFGPSPSSLPACSVPYCFQSKQALLLIHNGLHSLKSIAFMQSSADSPSIVRPVSAPFMISSHGFGFLRTITLRLMSACRKQNRKSLDGKAKKQIPLKK